MNKLSTSFMYTALIVTALVGSFFSPIVSVAYGQSLSDLMSMMNGNGVNETEDGMMMGDMMMGDMMMGDDNGNMSMTPFNMGVMVTPMMCTSPNELLGAFSGMLGGGSNAAGNGNGDNATEQMAVNMVQQQMMMAGGGLDGGMENMSEAHMQQMMNMAICFPMMGGEMMKGMEGMEGMMSMGQ
jgi:hypothetical protein